jgi:4-alpha-glucanotransferase
MNLVGTHDTERILTCLGVSGDEIERLSNTEKSTFKLSTEEYEKGVKRLKIASIIQYTVYGVPNLYYADEAGMEGFRDPFNRIPYPWGRENEELLEHYRALGKMRASEKVFRSGSFGAELISESAIRLVRADEKDKIIVIANRESYAITESLDGKYKDLVGGELYDGEITVDADTAVVLKKI